MESAYDGPYFAFRADPKLDSPKWKVYSMVFGLSFLLLSIPSIIHLWILRGEKRDGKTQTKLFMHAMILITALSRAFSFLVDPHYTREIISPFIVGVAYGLPFPALNAAIGLMLCILYEQLRAAGQMKQTEDIFLPNTRKIFIVMTILQFITQVASDIIAAASYDFVFLIVCPLYFIFWGFVVCTYATIGGWRLYKSLSPTLRRRAYKFFLNIYISVAMGLVMVTSSLFLLLFEMSDEVYFVDQVCVRIVEILACLLFLHAVIAIKQLSILVRSVSASTSKLSEILTSMRRDSSIFTSRGPRAAEKEEYSNFPNSPSSPTATVV